MFPRIWLSINNGNPKPRILGLMPSNIFRDPGDTLVTVTLCNREKAQLSFAIYMSHEYITEDNLYYWNIFLLPS